MQITLQVPGQPETAEQFVLMLVGQHYEPGHNITYEVKPDAICPICNTRPPVWFAYPASEAAMNPAASPIHVGEICATDLNNLLEAGSVEIANIDPDSF